MGVDIGLFGISVDGFLVCWFWYLKDVGYGVVVVFFCGYGVVFGVGKVEIVGFIFEGSVEFLLVLIEGVGDVFEEDKVENDVFVFGGIYVGVKFVGGGLECFFEVLIYCVCCGCLVIVIVVSLLLL